ncbi:hypothetical protein LTR94_037433, partial [Friedmanniomyces endolithicus]
PGREKHQPHRPEGIAQRHRHASQPGNQQPRDHRTPDAEARQVRCQRERGHGDRDVLERFQRTGRAVVDVEI